LPMVCFPKLNHPLSGGKFPTIVNYSALS